MMKIISVCFIMQYNSLFGHNECCYFHHHPAGLADGKHNVTPIKTESEKL